MVLLEELMIFQSKKETSLRIGLERGGYDVAQVHVLESLRLTDLVVYKEMGAIQLSFYGLEIKR